jgi:hypothetical protein
MVAPERHRNKERLCAKATQGYRAKVANERAQGPHQGELIEEQDRQNYFALQFRAREAAALGLRQPPVASAARDARARGAWRC